MIERLQTKYNAPENRLREESDNSWEKRIRKKQKNQLEYLRKKQHSILVQYQNAFPPYPLILPTRFGNILRASEVYPAYRYGIDAVPVFPRMIYVIPNEGMEKVDQANNQCLFLLNCSLLSVLFAIMCFFTSVYQAYLGFLAYTGESFFLYFIPVDLPANFYIQRVIIYLLLTIISAIIGRFFYEASLVNVGQYGSMIRSIYDLYRFKLLEALKQQLPKKSTDEPDIWGKISEFFTLGEELGSLFLEYNVDESTPSENMISVIDLMQEKKKD
jgi:hypothetical protein